MFKKKRIHFVGIGGIGMSALAEILYQKGFNISGSDVTENLLTQRLKKKLSFSIIITKKMLSMLI